MAIEKVSGVGKNAKRIDKNISKRTTQPMREIGSTKYGEGKALLQQQRGSKLQGQPTKIPKIDFNAMQTSGMGSVVPITSETERPNEVSETGMPFGDGAGPVDIGLNIGTGQPDSPQKNDLAKLSSYLPMIERAANSEDAPESLRTFVKYLKAQPGEIVTAPEQVSAPEEVSVPEEVSAPEQEQVSPSQEL
jgi:hypothetical protein